MDTCPHCKRSDRQVKAGKYGEAQRYKCMYCLRRYLSAGKTPSYSDEIKLRAVGLHLKGMTIRQVGRELGLNPRTIVNWARRWKGELQFQEPGRSAEHEPTEQSAVDMGSHGKRRPTIIDVAKHAGVSTSTVSNFLNHKGRMSIATRARIQVAANELNFTPNSLVRAIRQRRTHIIGIVAFGLHDLDRDMDIALSIPILSGINHAADGLGYNVLLYTGWPHRKTSMSGLDFLDGHIDGLIWVSPVLNTPLLEAVADAGLPTVALLSRIVPDGVGYVVSDNKGGIKKVVKHLAGLGHKRIAYVGPIDASDYLDRVEGYREGLKECSIAWDHALEVANDGISTNWPTHDMSGYQEALDRWLALAEPPTAIMVASDVLAGWMIDAIREQNLRVPEDIAVTGFDDLPAARYFGGGLTSVRQSFRQLGEAGVEALVDLIQGRPADHCRITLPTELVIRASTFPQVKSRKPE